ncbi:MAG: 50S ribosomal protein L11 methyltransferase [Parasphingorhabdus sp.]|nr:50S ribosomal protein L11 methyltransferase [Parasphingorhabdus sp.]
MTSWKLIAFAPKLEVQAALQAQDDVWDWDPALVISGSEVEEDRPDEWVLEAYYPAKPGKAQRHALAGLFAGKPPPIAIQKLPAADWVTLSQHNITPIRAGRFHIHTPDYPAVAPDSGAIDFVIPASQAFGTGHHETTRGCLLMLEAMRRQGRIFSNILDLGTGTGILAMAARHLWPAARVIASDIDTVAVDVARANAIANGIAPGAIRFLASNGLDDRRIAYAAPFDLIIANILAQPLIALSPQIAAASPPGGALLVAGLLDRQEAEVRHAFMRYGFRPRGRQMTVEWPSLWLVKSHGSRRVARHRSPLAPDYFGEV